MRSGLFFNIAIVLLACCWETPAFCAEPPPKRDIAGVRQVLAKAPKAPPESAMRSLRIVLVANRKDHGPHEHDYPRWMERWKALLGGSRSEAVNVYGPPSEARSPGAVKVTVETATDWPTADQFNGAALIVAFFGTGGIWNEAKLGDLQRYLARGGGFVTIHSAVIAEKPHAAPLAQLLGLAWESGHTLYRHGALDLKISAPEHPICKGLPERIKFEDETYWPLISGSPRVTVLGTADEPARGSGKLEPQPMFWTHEAGRGRVFNSILGHYTWTFDDPYFRILLLRGMAWAAGESPYRFDPLVLAGARTTDREPPVSRKRSVPAIPPRADDPNLLLWLDASEPVTVKTEPDGKVALWSSRAARTSAKLTSVGRQQPMYAAKALGGRPAVRFDGTDDSLRDLAFRQTADSWTIAIVTTPKSNAGLFRALLSANRPGINDYQSGFNIDLGPAATSEFSSLNLEGIKGGGATNLRAESAPFGEGQVLVLSTGGGGSRLWVNGNQEEGRGAGHSPTVMDEVRLGARFYLGEERGYFHGDISEVLIYRGQLSDSRRAGLEAHLTHKYRVRVTPGVNAVHDPWDYLPAYGWGSSRRPLAPIDDAIVSSRRNPAARKALESKLLAVLADSASTPAARDFAGRRLALIGSAASIPTLAALSADALLSGPALFALERIPHPAAAEALAEALKSAIGKPRLGIISALGNRKHAASIPYLTGLLNDSDSQAAEAAATALGRMAARDSTAALLSALEKDTRVGGAAADALLNIAESELSRDSRGNAELILRRLAQPDVPISPRLAASRRLLLLPAVVPVAQLLDHLRNSHPQVRSMALDVLRALNEQALRSELAAALGELPEDLKARVVSALADRGDRWGIPVILNAMRREQSKARLAAVKALGRVGGAGEVLTLLEAAADSDDAVAAAAGDSLSRISGSEVDAVILNALDSNVTTIGMRRAAIEALGRRGYAPSSWILSKIAREGEPSLRPAAVTALGQTAPAESAGALAAILAKAESPEMLGAAEAAIGGLIDRVSDKAVVIESLAAATPEANPRSRAALLRAMSLYPSPKSLAAVLSARGDSDAEVREQALELLFEWETVDAAKDLLGIARTTGDPAHHTLALRGYIRLAAAGGLPAERRLAMCRAALQASARDEERRLVLSALAAIPLPGALEEARRFLKSSLSEEAAIASIEVAEKLAASHAALIAEVLGEVLTSTEDASLQRRASELRARAESARKR